MYLNDLSAIQKLNCMCTFVLQRGAAFSRLVQVVRMLLSSASVLQISYMLNIEVGENGPEWGDREKGGSLQVAHQLYHWSITRSYKTQFQTNFKSESKIQTHLQL